MTSLPTLRRKIFKSFSVVVALYAVLGALLVMSVNIASKTTPKLLHVNYDSIAAAHQMDESWSALQFPAYAGGHTHDEWVKKFSQALGFEGTNITEVGELEIATKIKNLWEQVQPHLGHLSETEFQTMRTLLDQIIVVNERGMFGLAQGNALLSKQVLVGTIVYFLLSLLLCLFFADNLAERLSSPLKRIAEALHGRQSFLKKLKLPDPTNLEILVLTTELKRLWERVSESEKVNVSEVLQQKSKLETLLESVDDGLLVLHANGTVSHCNSCLLSLLQIPFSEIQDKPWTDLPVSNENYIRLRSTLRPGMPEGQQIDLDWKQAVSFFSARSRKIENGDPEKTGVLYLLHDITEKKQREKFRSEFIDLLSHELKTPLQSLGTASELLMSQKGILSEDTRTLVETVAEDVERIKAVAHEFVQITQSHAKVMKIKLELVPIHQALTEWIKPFSLIAKDKKVKIDYTQDGPEVIWGNIDLVKFPWVVSNLLSNSVRFSPVDSTIKVRLTQTENSVQIWISDSGPGISEEEQIKMFEPFYQGNPSSSSGARGLFGVGLTIAKEVVEAHDGRIEYFQVEPHGSQFKIILPLPNHSYGSPEPSTGSTKSWNH
jgi:NtrC-family two-component system sensor histidine kinase KinB